MNKIITAIATATLLTATAVGSAMASGSVTPTPTPTVAQNTNNNAGGYGVVTPCQITYGGGTNCPTTQILIDKTVKNPSNGQFVDNLDVNDPKYNPGSTVVFNLKVTNTSPNTLNSVGVKDILPANLTYINGVNGASYDNNSKTLTFNAGDFTSGQTKSFTVNAKVDDASNLPQNQGIVCETNQSIVSVNDFTNQDNASFCIQNPTLGTTTPTTKGGQVIYPVSKAKTTPKTGPEMLDLLALIPSALGGVILRRKTR